MQLTMTSEQQVLQEGVGVLIKHLGAAKTVRFLSAWRQGVGDYLQLREQIFVGETVDTLYEKIGEYENRNHSDQR